MMNNVNSLEFFKTKLLTMDKYNSTTASKLFPPSSLSQTRADHQKINAIDSLQENFLNNEMKHQDRVRVQHLQNHTKLQNNKCWNNFRTFYNASASLNIRDNEILEIRQTNDDTEVDVLNLKQLSSTIMTPLNIQNKSAFNLDLNNKYHNNNIIVGNNNYIDNVKHDASIITEANNNFKLQCKSYIDNNYGLIHNQSPNNKMIVMSAEQQLNTTDSQRTEDQDTAFWHIESVHNYAKSKSFEGDYSDKISPNGSRHSSYLDDDDEDDDEEDDDNDDNNYYEDGLRDDLDADYEDIFINRSYKRFQKLSTSYDGALLNKTSNIISKRDALIELDKPAHFVNKMNNHKIKDSYEDEEIHIDVDVETIESQPSPTTLALDTNFPVANNCSHDESAIVVKPDHHARRPMNAFLIFCKRHRAIVKERYKNLENRAITKILGDWWASLDSNEKKCFTNLAQQNKDAFFSANPNFKWYKLPAPPLRTLTTRPTNTFGQEYQEENGTNGLEYNNNHSNYFKLADEAQMGDLSQLMQDKSKIIKQCVDLQHALGETSQFMSAHITGNSDALEENLVKRRFYNENSFSSNSSEDDIIEPKKKNARSCKGKRYQELINSGQIATAFKKTKSSTRPAGADGSANSEINIKQSLIDIYNFNNPRDDNVCQNRSLPESDNMIPYDLNGFDLEEKIKELPALNLDNYLQRKRNTKKKKKFSSNGKKRGLRSNNSNINAIGRCDNDNQAVKNLSQAQVANLSNERLDQHHQLAKQHQQAATAVGSQKRKARKESITRRDVSAIEEEVASLLPLTINGCCYFQEAPTAIKYKKDIEKDTEVNNIKSQSLDLTSISSIIPFKQISSSAESIDLFNSTNISNNILNDNISSSTSDLLILAEVAANRTELKH